MATYNGYVIGGTLSLRASTTTNSQRLATIPNGATVAVSTITFNNLWFQTTYNGQAGYVMAEFIAITNDGGSCVVTTQNTGLNVRNTPSGDVIYTAERQSTLRLLDYTSVAGWYRVSSNQGTGWASAEYLTITSYSGGASGGEGNVNGYPIEATVETAKHGDGGYLNMRSSTSSSSERVTTIPNGATIYVQALSGEWLAAKYGSYTGYVMAVYVAESDLYGADDGQTNVPAGNEVYGTICGDEVNIRALPSTSADIVGRLFDGDPVVYYANESYSGDGYNWYRIRFDGDAYIASNYVGVNTDDHTVVHTVAFDPLRAVEYASNHTQTTEVDPTSNYHTGFGWNTSDCANFVNQCLCAGGLPMFKGWSDNLNGIPSNWSNHNWQLTNATRCPLLVKGRIYQIEYTEVKKGDIIYVYNNNQSVSPNRRYEHVMIAASDYNPLEGGCRVHGHTTNQNNVFRTLNSSDFRCYRVANVIKVEACEKRVYLPVAGSTYSVLD